MHKRGLVRKSERCPEKEQREALIAAGVADKNIYDFKDRQAFILSLRKGDAAVVDGYHRLGTSWPDITDALHAIWSREAFVMDARTGEVASAAVVALVAIARTVIAGELRIPNRAEAIKRGLMGGAKEKQRKLTKAQMKAIWLDPNIKTNQDAVDKCGGVPIRTLYNYFGPSGRPAGWKRKSK